MLLARMCVCVHVWMPPSCLTPKALEQVYVRLGCDTVRLPAGTTEERARLLLSRCNGDAPSSTRKA